MDKRAAEDKEGEVEVQNIQKKKRSNDFVDILFKKCKEHGGPVTSGQEVKDLVANYDSKELKQFLRQEIQYQRVTHPRDVAARPDLYKVNKNHRRHNERQSHHHLGGHY